MFPYSAAQQPVQWRLQAEVGSSRMAQGILQPYRSRASSWMGQPMRLPLSIKFSKKVLRTSPSTSVHRLRSSLYQLLSGFSITWRKAARWLGKLLGPSPAKRSTQSIRRGMLASGSLSR